MRTIDKRIEKLERMLPPQALQAETRWGSMAAFRDRLLRNARERGGQVAVELKRELDERGPMGTWLELVRSHLRRHGFEQMPHESFAQTMARSLGIGTSELRELMVQGRLGHELANRFSEPQ